VALLLLRESMRGCARQAGDAGVGRGRGQVPALRGGRADRGGADGLRHRVRGDAPDARGGGAVHAVSGACAGSQPRADLAPALLALDPKFAATARRLVILFLPFLLS